jgi:hypothetical protein
MAGAATRLWNDSDTHYPKVNSGPEPEPKGREESIAVALRVLSIRLWNSAFPIEW